MKNELDKLEAIFKTSLDLTLKNTDLENIDSILDNRDEPEFSDAWMKAYQFIEQKVTDPDVKTKIDKIRKEVYILTFRKTESSDLSAYISDDLDLICSYYVHGIESTWVNDLLFTYLHHHIPQQTLMEANQSINELIK